MIHVAVCDDEKIMSDKIRKLTLDFFRGKNMEISVSQFSNGADLLKCDRPIDILFLDIQMTGMDGMETARKLRERGYTGFVIFITVVEEMVFDSFAVQAYDYLVKPIEKPRFEKTMERLYVSVQSEKGAYLFVKRGYESRIISFGDIIFCEIIDKKVYLHLKNGEIVDYYDKMEHLETCLDERFYRCHRSFLINLQHLKGYKDGFACLEDGNTVPVSRLRSREFSEVVLKFVAKKG